MVMVTMVRGLRVTSAPWRVDRDGRGGFEISEEVHDDLELIRCKGGSLSDQCLRAHRCLVDGNSRRSVLLLTL